MNELVPRFTRSHHKNLILAMLCCFTRLSTVSLQVAGLQEKVVWKKVSELRQDGLVATTNTKPMLVGLTKAGAELVKITDIDFYRYYMAISGNQHPGGTDLHKEIERRSGEILALMFGAGIRIGPMKPTAEQIRSGDKDKLKANTPTFFLNKEMRYATAQKESRETVSRSSGSLLSSPLQCVVYNIMDGELLLSRNAERSAIIRLKGNRSELYDDLPKSEIKDSIVTCSDDKIALNIFSEPKKNNGKKKAISEAIWNPAFLQTDFRYIPFTRDGSRMLNFITTRTQEEILNFCFTSSELESARRQNTGDGIVGNLICYEFLSCNITKLAKLKRSGINISNVGILCWDSQLDFIRQFLGVSELHLRTFNPSAYTDRKL